MATVDADTQRRVEVRVLELIEAADEAEAAAVDALIAELRELQRAVRVLIADAGPADYAALMLELDQRIAATFEQLEERLTDHITAAATAGATLVSRAATVAGATNVALVATAALAAPIADRAVRLLAGSRDDLAARLSSTVLLRASGQRDLEQTLAAVGTRLRGSFAFGAPTDRAVKVTRTEGGHAHGAAADQAMAATTGATIRKRWVWSHKTDGRDTHAEAEARYRPGGDVGPIAHDQTYRVGNFKTPYPRGPGLPGAQKLNCGCRSVPVVTEVET